MLYIDIIYLLGRGGGEVCNQRQHTKYPLAITVTSTQQSTLLAAAAVAQSVRAFASHVECSVFDRPKLLKQPVTGVSVTGPRKRPLLSDVPCHINGTQKEASLLNGHECRIKVKNLQPFAGNGDVSIRVNNSRVGRKNHKNKQKNPETLCRAL